MNKNEQFLSRVMTAHDLPIALALCEANGWNQTQRDWEMFLARSPQGCFVAVTEEQVIGTVTTIRYEGQFSWIGMMLVDPAYRRQGIGEQLMRKALQSLQDEGSVRLDATPAGYPLYRKLGFVDEYGLNRMIKTSGSDGWRNPDNPARALTSADLPEICALDREVFGANRRVLLEWMLANAPKYAWIVRQGGQPLGYMFGRSGKLFEHLGPVVAKDQQTAQYLVAAALHEHLERSFVLDIPQDKADWKHWLEAIGFCQQRPLTRMFYKKNHWPDRAENQFAILGPEFG